MGQAKDMMREVLEYWGVLIIRIRRSWHLQVTFAKGTNIIIDHEAGEIIRLVVSIFLSIRPSGLKWESQFTATTGANTGAGAVVGAIGAATGAGHGDPYFL